MGKNFNIDDFSLDAVDAFLGKDSHGESNDQSCQDEEKKQIVEKEDNKQPKRKFNPTSMTFEYEDEEAQKKHDLRAKLNSMNRDVLADRQAAIKIGLEEMGFSSSDMGQTGNSFTGEVLDRHRKIAKSQAEDAKAHIIRTRKGRD